MNTKNAKKDGKGLEKPYEYRTNSRLRYHMMNKPMASLNIGPVSGHLFYATLG
jgi:hypothetical protein